VLLLVGRRGGEGYGMLAHQYIYGPLRFLSLAFVHYSAHEHHAVEYSGHCQVHQLVGEQQ
jgi:hypothetical protein